jgi:hypothetical protein
MNPPLNLDPKNMVVPMPNHPQFPNLERTATFKGWSLLIDAQIIEIMVLITHRANVNGVLQITDFQDKRDSLFAKANKFVNNAGDIVPPDELGNYPAGITLHIQFDFWIEILKNPVSVFGLIWDRIYKAGQSGELEVPNPIR